MTTDQALRLAEKEMDRFESTRSIQWKFNFTVWALIASIIYFFQKEQIYFNPGNLRWGCVFFITLYIVFIYMNQSSLATSKAVWNDIIKKINAVGPNDPDHITVDIKKITEKSHFKFQDGLWILFYIYATGFLLFTLIHINDNVSK
ncbi:MAG TPA: hypothetical protein VIV35_04705 [Chitinophagaceae bacterium]